MSTPSTLDDVVVDVHAHTAPPSLLAELDRSGGACGARLCTDDAGVRRVHTAERSGAPLHPLLSDPAARLRFLDQAGIDIQLIAPWIELTGYQLAPAYGADFADLVNRHIAEEAASAPGRLIGLGTVPLQLGGEAAAQVLRTAMERDGLAGVQIATHVPGSSLSDPALAPFFSAAEQLGAVVLLHPHYTDELRPMLPALEFAAGNPADTTLAIAQLMFTGRLAEHPDLRLVLAHGGGFLPYQIGRIAAAWQLADASGPDPVELLSRLYADTIVHEPAALRFLIDRLGPDRLVMGTDYPFALGDLDPVASYQRAELAPVERRRMLGATLWGLLPSAVRDRVLAARAGAPAATS